MKPPDAPTTNVKREVWNGPTSMVLRRKPPKYGRARATTGTIRDPDIVSAM